MSKTSLPHIHTMHRKDFHTIMEYGWIDLWSITEKTDGYAFRFGKDADGFWSMSSQSGGNKMRSAQDYEDRATLRTMTTGKTSNFAAARTFGTVHAMLAFNTKLQKFLSDKVGDVCIAGEILWRPEALHNEGLFTPVGTPYYINGAGAYGKFIVHTQMPENVGHRIDFHLNEVSNDLITFGIDEITTTNRQAMVDLYDIRDDYDILDHNLILNRKTKKNAFAVDVERAKATLLQDGASLRVDYVFEDDAIEPKWGPETEGYVIHPTDAMPQQPRFKVTSSSFRKFRETV